MSYADFFFHPTRFMADPFADSFQMIPEDLFVLVKAGIINHEEFVMLAVFHKETD